MSENANLEDVKLLCEAIRQVYRGGHLLLVIGFEEADGNPEVLESIELGSDHALLLAIGSMYNALDDLGVLAAENVEGITKDELPAVIQKIAAILRRSRQQVEHSRSEVPDDGSTNPTDSD